MSRDRDPATDDVADAATADTADTAAADTADTADTAGEAYEVPPDATTYDCPRCGRPFARERHRDLHLGQSHADLADDERGAYEAARDEETADLRRFRIVSLGLLVLFYFGFLFMFAIFG
ncbi:DUF7410 domain-containing protein [Halobaculum lipolyticum]|uniref:C2H2-type zinc finger protein n=1 Tax=Halobaculum lipolyticum TaxID=3032001 RepID=A0ABD5WHX5_9EURY|nr:DNA-binding protein [Halobaculum sp. DT31]